MFPQANREGTAVLASLETPYRYPDPLIFLLLKIQFLISVSIETVLLPGSEFRWLSNLNRLELCVFVREFGCDRSDNLLINYSGLAFLIYRAISASSDVANDYRLHLQDRVWWEKGEANGLRRSFLPSHSINSLLNRVNLFIVSQWDPGLLASVNN